MTPHEYQKLAERTESMNFNDIADRMVGYDKMVRLQHASAGLCTEAGEFMDMLKKHIYYGKDLDEVNLAEEIGDIFWYAALACNALDIELEDVMAKNIKKLAARYPDKFKEEDALHRNLEQERRTLENDE